MAAPAAVGSKTRSSSFWFHQLRRRSLVEATGIEPREAIKTCQWHVLAICGVHVTTCSRLAAAWRSREWRRQPRWDQRRDPVLFGSTNFGEEVWWRQQGSNRAKRSKHASGMFWRFAVFT